jgi:hypothetical protein
MGAEAFDTTAYGKTQREAFEAAKEHARYEHGHGGYTGTIAEKGDYAHVVLPKGVTVPAFLKLLEDADQLYWTPAAVARELADHDRYGVGARKTWMGKTLRQRQNELGREQAKYERFWARVDKRPGLRAALTAALPLYSGDKWGPALCLGPLTGKLAQQRMTYAVGTRHEQIDDRWVAKAPRGQKLWLFLGYASS